MALYFTLFIANRLTLIEAYVVIQYFPLIVNITFPISLFFQLSVVIMFLTEINILNPERLKRMRKIAYKLFVIISAVVTPLDLVSALLVRCH